MAKPTYQRSLTPITRDAGTESEAFSLHIVIAGFGAEVSALDLAFPFRVIHCTAYPMAEFISNSAILMAMPP